MASTHKEIKELNIIDIENVAEEMTDHICHFLKEELEELEVSVYQFKIGVKKSFSRVLNYVLIHKNNKIQIFPDTLPGFTVVFVKKTTLDGERTQIEELTASDEIVQDVINKFFMKNNKKVLMIDNPGFSFILFPVGETKEYLKEMGI